MAPLMTRLKNEGRLSSLTAAPLICHVVAPQVALSAPRCQEMELKCVTDSCRFPTVRENNEATPEIGSDAFSLINNKFSTVCSSGFRLV